MSKIKSIALGKLVDHPENPNKMSSAFFSRLCCNISRSGRYEPLIVRRHPDEDGCYQIINGHHRRRALAKAGAKTADCIVWDVDDEQARILLMTLNRLAGSDIVGKKTALLRQLTDRVSADKLARILPQTKMQIEKLINFKRPAVPLRPGKDSFAHPLVFFLSSSQKRTITESLELARQSTETAAGPKAVRNAAALAVIAEFFINHSVRG